MQTLTYILAFIFILGSAVVLHEFGHFLVAKLLKIRVETFSVGFGPRLFGKKWGDTDYRVSAVPLGGYVKLGGDESNAPIEGEGVANIPERERFDLRPRYQRIMVALAGPIMNIITALSIPFIGAMMYGVPVSSAPIVSYVQQGGAAQTAGLQPGDHIVSFNGTENPTWEAISGDALLSPEQPVAIVVNRAGQRVPLTITPSSINEGGDVIGSLDFVPDNGGYPVTLKVVVPDSPAAKAGLQVGDHVVAIKGDSVRSAEHVTKFIREHKHEPITLTVERNGTRQDVTASAAKLPDGTERLGFTPVDDYPLTKPTVGAAAGFAVRSNVEILRLTGKALGQVFVGKRSVRNTLSGPIGIYEASARSVERLGWGGLFQMMAILSLNLGIFNLLPIPVLDGGAIFILLIEGALAPLGLSLSMRVRERIQQVGFVAVLLLMVFVISNDLLKKFTRAPDTQAPSSVSPGK
ncbi:MAG TPA: RIP metalloprotease RseP [Pyrinomonadaceae bacterium]|nr:RIP metalloprotease RseP [Pyrinomonadaceae bacterium]